MTVAARSSLPALRRRRVVVTYLVLAGMWILVTDQLAFLFGTGSGVEQTIKGGAFVAVTAGVLGVLLRRHDSRLADEQLARRDRERQLDLIAEVTQDVIYRIELAPRRFTFISPAIVGLLGISPREVLDDPGAFDGFVHPHDRDRRAATAEDPVIRLRWCRRDGRTVWVEQRNRRESHDGVPTAIVGIARDVTAEVLDAAVRDASARLDQGVLDGRPAADALRELAESLRGTLEAARLRIWLDTGHGAVPDVDVAADPTGWAPPAQLPERDLAAVLGSCDGVRVELTPTWRTPTPELVEPLLDRLASRFANYAHHEQRRLELERLEVALRATGIAILLADDEGRILWVNDAFERLTGYASDLARSATVAILAGTTGRALQAEILARSAAGHEFEAELPLQRADGSEFIATLTVAPVRHGDGSFAGIVAALRDVTEKRRAGQQLHAAQISVLRRERDLERQRTVLVQTLSHELRTPLTVVVGAAQTLQRDNVTTDARGRLVRSLERGTDDLLRHLDSLLAATDGLAGDVVATTARAVIASALERLASRHDLGRVEISGDAPWTGPAAEAASLLRPLLHNALKFSPDDTTVEVRITSGVNWLASDVPEPPHEVPQSDGVSRSASTEACDVVVIEVVDHGPGMPPDMVPLLERPFRQADSSVTRPHGGLGLGLHAARRSADRLGARIATHTASTGTRVRVELPRGSGPVRPAI